MAGSLVDRHNLQVLLCSTRDGRQGDVVARWMVEQATRHGRFDVELIDLADIDLPLLDEPQHPRFQKYVHEHTKRWSGIVARADAFVFVTPEYDYGPPAALINAIQYLFHEWTYKAVGFTSYGGVSGGTRGVQVTKQICTTVKMVPLSEAVSIPFFTQHINPETRVFDPGAMQEKAATVMLDELVRWTEALRVLRAPRD